MIIMPIIITQPKTDGDDGQKWELLSWPGGPAGWNVV